VWSVPGEDVGKGVDFCSCKIRIHAIRGVQTAVKPSWGIIQPLNSNSLTIESNLDDLGAGFLDRHISHPKHCQ